MLRQRVLSALVFAPLVLGSFFLGGGYFIAFVLLLSAVAAVEFRRVVRSATEIPPVFVPVCMAVSVSGWADDTGRFLVTLLGGALVLLFVCLLRKSTPSAVYALAGEMYVGGLLGALSLLRSGDEGRVWSLFVLLVTWATDTGAYFGGLAFGKRKLAPAISPSKSWEGAVSGVVAAALVSLGLPRFLDVPWPIAFITGVSLGVLAETGDLVESLLKRFGQVKDSGRAIPGHGGILDRFDSLLFTGAGALVIHAIYSLFR